MLIFNIIDLAIDLPSEGASGILSWVYPVSESYCALIGTSYCTGRLWTRLEHELVDANRVCPGIHKVRVGPATRSAVATCNYVIKCNVI